MKTCAEQELGEIQCPPLGEYGEKWHNLYNHFLLGLASLAAWDMMTMC